MEHPQPNLALLPFDGDSPLPDRLWFNHTFALGGVSITVKISRHRLELVVQELPLARRQAA